MLNLQVSTVITTLKSKSKDNWWYIGCLNCFFLESSEWDLLITHYLHIHIYIYIYYHIFCLDNNRDNDNKPEMRCSSMDLTISKRKQQFLPTWSFCYICPTSRERGFLHLFLLLHDYCRLIWPSHILGYLNFLIRISHLHT